MRLPLPSKRTTGALIAILFATILFYWRILFTNEFSLLTDSESVNQAYSWFHFWVSSIRQGLVPLWDPYTFAGRSFIGEMQTGAFYPLRLLLALVPFNENGVFSPRLYHLWFAFSHVLGAWFMFALVRELGLSRFSAVVAGLCFSLGGFVGHVPWPHMLESSIWLPLIVLFLLRALRPGSTGGEALLYAALAGLALGIAALAGGMHVVIMQGLVVVSAGAFACFRRRSQTKAAPGFWVAPVLVVVTTVAVGFCIAAVQLLPSIEYSGQAIRFLGNAPPQPADRKIPLAFVHDAVLPNGIWGLLFAFGFNGAVSQGEPNSYYLGVFPFIAAIVGVIRFWKEPWVRYFVGLGAAAFLYALSGPSIVHGVLYTFTPGLWMAREPTRFVYLLGFALAVLIAFGIEALFARSENPAELRGFHRVLTGFVILCAVLWTVSAVYGRPVIEYWTSFSLILLFASYGLVQFLLRGHCGRATQVLAVGLILFDLSAFDWTARNTYELAKTGAHYLDRILSCRGAADFLRSRPGLFRVAVFAEFPPNIGNLYGIPALNGGGATLTTTFAGLGGRTDLLNGRYFLRPASWTEPGAIYEDAAWKVYENPGAFPRAWVVHEAIVEPSRQAALVRIQKKEVDARRTALVPSALPVALDPASEEAGNVSFAAYEPGRMEMNVATEGRGLVVLSEMFYPGWRATVNGKEVEIYNVNGALRGILVEGGKSRITLRYAPRSVLFGGLLSALGVVVVLLALIREWWRRRELNPRPRKPAMKSLRA